ncbi:hypothetical protein, partial [Neisseria meningitidis]|uniref:hypothetical protein n=1 Tax=Neisseria meningitidis TaxID=487 RepID=UPI001C5B2D22
VLLKDPSGSSRSISPPVSMFSTIFILTLTEHEPTGPMSAPKNIHTATTAVGSRAWFLVFRSPLLVRKLTSGKREIMFCKSWLFLVT